MQIVTSPPAFLKLLAHDLRWNLLTALAHSDHRVQELVDLVDRPMNLVSYHLKQLRDHHLVHERRSSADGRDVYYSLDLTQLETLYHQSGAQLHPVLSCVTTTTGSDMSVGEAPQRVLFLCTHNSARSQMAEGLLRHLSGGQIAAFSAGDQPAVVHPLAIATMAAFGIDITGQRAKHLNEFRGDQFDLIVTVCDQVREQCPTFPGDPTKIHWSIADPLAANSAMAATVFQETAQLLRTRMNYLLLALADEKSATV